MNALPDRYAYGAPPIATGWSSFGDLVPSVESASLWMWWWPRLLGWSKRIHWLFSPMIDSHRKTPGDLWGLDTTGSLIIVETKFDRGSALKDPFRSFASYINHDTNPDAWSTKELRSKWLKRASGTNPVEKDLMAIWSTEPITAHHRAIFPYSFRRYAVSCFGSLYCTNIVPVIMSGTSRLAIERALRIREAASDPPPVFVRLVGSMQSSLQLSKEGRRNCLVLQERVGESRVVLRAINARLGLKGLRIHCWSPEANF